MNVDGCVSVRELIRESSRWLAETERNGKVFAIHRYGRLIALMTPLPERVTLEFPEQKREEQNVPLEEDPDPDLELDLDAIEIELLERAAAGNPSWWEPPSHANVFGWLASLSNLEHKRLTVTRPGGACVLTPRGKRTAETLKRLPASARGPG